MDDQKSFSIAFLTISDQYATLIFFTKWLPAAILVDRKSLLIAFLVISDQYTTFCFTKWLPAAILDYRKSLLIAFLTISDRYITLFLFIFQNGRRQPFWKTENHFRSHFSPFQINTQLFLLCFFQNGRRQPFWKSEKHFRSHFSPFRSHFSPVAILEVRFPPKTIGFFHYVLSMAMPNMKLIGEFMTGLENPQAF